MVKMTTIETDPLEVLDASDIRPRPWLVEGVLMRGQLTLLTGRGGGGKSLLALQWAVAVARGAKWLNWQPATSERVLLLSVEDDLDELHRRVVGVARQMGVAAHELKGRIDVIRGSSATMVEHSPQGPRRTAFYEALAAKRLEYGLIVVDPLVSLHEGLNENDNADMQALAGALRDLSRLAPACPVLAVHHTRKGSQAADADSARGASAVVNAARLVLGLDSMSDKEATELLDGNEFRERWRYARVTTGKSNYSRRGADQWLRLELHRLPCGDESPAWEGWQPEIPVELPVVSSPPGAKGMRGTNR